ncbi:MAG TPA: hypothetical protein IAD14_00300 [Candidatus Coprousia avicola]|nr:hypothetical protein [Candidatus Coprousia avicola]
MRKNIGKGLAIAATAALVIGGLTVAAPQLAAAAPWCTNAAARTCTASATRAATAVSTGATTSAAAQATACPNYRDADGDGVCDNCASLSAAGSGICNNNADGSCRHRHTHGCGDTGAGCGNGHGRGWCRG